MSSRQQIDSVIDDDDEFCPLCIEEFDLSDKNFKPCPCGYQICQFCYNNIKTQNEEGRCPNCRRVYDESTIQYKVPDADEFKADLALKHRKAAAAKKKEAEKREIEASSRKNLAGVRVVQKNLVYVIGLNPTIRDESQLLQTLRGKDYFGQYGEIEKIVVSKAKPGGNPNQGIGVYVTYAKKSDAATCIAAVDGSGNGDRILRAQYGTTKYCSSFLRNEQCHNRNCTFLHETGEDSDSYSRQDLSSMNSLPSQQRPNGNAGPSSATPPYIARSSAQPISQTLRRQPSKDDAGGTALPSSASWANKDSAINRTRRASLTGSQASQSPRSALATVATPSDDTKRVEKQQTQQDRPQTTQTPSPDAPSSNPPRPPSAQTPTDKGTPLLDNLLKAVNSPCFKFIFSAAGLPPDELALIDNHPSLIDPYGGVKRRAMREKAEQERTKREQELLQSVPAATTEDEGRESGSLQLGGEPDDTNPPRGRAGRESHGAIQPPSQQGTTASSAVGSPVSAASHHFQGINMNNRSLTPLQQQQLMLLKSAGNQQAGLVDPMQSGVGSNALDHAAQARQSLLQSQAAQLNALQQAQRGQNSRFSFTDANAKNLANTRMLNQASLMQSGTPNPLAAPSPQHSLASNYYTSGVQGPPPGLKTAGTPPVSGGGMFAQGHGFTSNVNLLGGKQEANPELMRELLRGRSGTNASGLPDQDNKLHLADPSILQARMHQVGANAVAGQGLYGSQGQVDEEFPPLGTTTKDKRSVDSFGSLMRSQLMSDSQPLGRSGTPSLPPGLPLPQGHSISALFQDQFKSSSPVSSVSGPPPGLEVPSPSLAAASRSSDDDAMGLASKSTADNKQLPNRATSAADVSLGSPVAKSATRVRSQPKEESVPAVEKKGNQPKPTGSSEGKVYSAKVKPMKLDLSFNTPPAPEPVQKTEPPPYQLSAAPATAVNSRPNTPLTGASRVSDSPAPRQPRVLRVVDTPKAETPPPMSATQSVASFSLTSKVRSRRPSASSQSRSDTPGDIGSEADLYTSTSASRANSPPASSRIGSAPVRSITKSQLKKERKQKAKEAEAKKQETAPVTEEPVIAPIVGRKRKTKKAPAESPNPSPENAASTTKPTVAVANEPTEKVEPAKKSKAPETVSESKPPPSEAKAPAEEKKTEEWRSKNTVEQLLKDAEATGVPLKELFAERTSPLQVLLSQLHKSGALDLNTHPLFNPSNLNQRFDMKCTSDDYEDLKQPIELTEQHRKALLRGEPVRLGSDSPSLKHRCLISPRGCVLHHLSPEEEDRYLALEKSVSWNTDSFQEYPAIPVTEPDATNRGGGLDALFATPENFNVCWVDETSTGGISAQSPTSAHSTTEGGTLTSIPPNVLSAMEADSTRNHNWAISNAAELMNATATSVRSFAAATAKHMLGAAGVVIGNIPDLDDVVGMTDEELRSFAVKSQKELEASRKELDAIDKKLGALVKRNRKLAQQALAT